MKKHIIQIAPVIPLPILRPQVFLYWHDRGLPVGTLVSIPFWFREVQGIVIESKKSAILPSSLKLKGVKLVIEDSYLNEKQIKLAQKISEYYLAPLGSVLKLMIPKVAKTGNKEKIILKKAVKKAKMGAAGLKILKSRKSKFLMEGTARWREETNVNLIYGFTNKGKQCLILVPEVFFSYGVYEKFRGLFPEKKIALMHGRIAKGQFYDSWERIRTGEIEIIVASKLGIFLPFFDLGLIIAEEEQDSSYKQSEAMPRYNAIKGAEFLAEITGAKLVLESSLPSVENFYRAKEKELELIRSFEQTSLLLRGNGFDKDSKIEFEVIYPEKEKIKSYFPLSKKLHAFVTKTIKDKKQTVIFVNRRGFSTRTICENCKKTLKCPKCEKPLVYSDERGQYFCLRCAFRADLFFPCPVCGSFQFSHRGVGTQTVERKIKKLFPEAMVSRLDGDILRSLAKYKGILQKFSAGNIDILVGTQAAIKGIYSGRIDLVAAISGRDFADGRDFNSRHIALSRLFNMANLLRGNGKMVVQSFFSGNPPLDIFGREELEKYYKSEHAIRKKFHYPPFSKLISLKFRNRSQKTVLSETRKVFDLLQRASDNKIEIIGPYNKLVQLEKGLYKRNILIKMNPAMNVVDLPIRPVIAGLGKGWSVDVDPVNLF